MAGVQNSKRRWYQFSLKTLLALVVSSCVLMGLLSVPVFRARRQATAVAALKKLRCVIEYDYEFRPGARTKGPTPVPGPLWLRRWIGDDYFTNVVRLSMYDPKAGDAELNRLRDLPRLEQLMLWNTQITDVGLEQLTGLKQLKYLSLSRTRVSDAGIDALNAVPALLVVNLQGTRVTEAGLARLKAHGAIGGSPIVTRILTALGDPSVFDFSRQSLGDVIEYLKALHDIEIHLDSRLTAAPRAATPITAKLDGIMLAEALDEILKAVGLDYDLRYEMLYISAKPMSPRLRLPDVAEGAAPAAALAAKTGADFTAAPLSQVLAYLRQQHGVSSTSST